MGKGMLAYGASKHLKCFEAMMFLIRIYFSVQLKTRPFCHDISIETSAVSIPLLKLEVSQSLYAD
jgi:hypothetical protein